MTLVLLLVRCPNQLAADMRGEYGLAIHDLPPMQVALLAVNLPDGSLVWQELNTARAWTFDQYLAVLRIEQMNLWMWANTDPKKSWPATMSAATAGEARSQAGDCSRAAQRGRGHGAANAHHQSGGHERRTARPIHEPTVHDREPCGEPAADRTTIAKQRKAKQ